MMKGLTQEKSSRLLSPQMEMNVSQQMDMDMEREKDRKERKRGNWQKRERERERGKKEKERKIKQGTRHAAIIRMIPLWVRMTCKIVERTAERERKKEAPLAYEELQECSCDSC